MGDLLLLQCKDISMGIDPTPFWANLYLYDYGADFISNFLNWLKKIKTDRSTTIKFKNTPLFIRNECNLNDSGEFSKSFHAI